MTVHLADLSSTPEYRVRLEFTGPMEPRLLADGMPYISLLKEIEANSLTARAAEIRDEYGRIPYSSPLYWWETHSRFGRVTCAYIGQTVHLELQRRFESHAKLVQLLATHVNERYTRVMFRLCSRLDITYGGRRVAIEHLPPDQASKVIDDVEASLIYEHQPPLNSHHKRAPKVPWKPFAIETFRLG